MEKRADEESRHVVLLHQLGERLTAAGSYIQAAQSPPESVPHHASPPAADILELALAQLDQADEIVAHLRKALDGSSPPDSGAGRSYRVCFMNRFARGDKMITACQRTIIIPSAPSREAAIKVAKQRFAELEGIRDWHIHASFIEAGVIEERPHGGFPTHSDANGLAP